MVPSVAESVQFEDGVSGEVLALAHWEGAVGVS